MWKCIFCLLVWGGCWLVDLSLHSSCLREIHLRALPASPTLSPNLRRLYAVVSFLSNTAFSSSSECSGLEKTLNITNDLTSVLGQPRATQGRKKALALVPGPLATGSPGPMCTLSGSLHAQWGLTGAHRGSSGTFHSSLLSAYRWSTFEITWERAAAAGPSGLSFVIGFLPCLWHLSVAYSPAVAGRELGRRATISLGSYFCQLKRPFKQNT